MRDIPKISDAEWRVMKVLWEAAPRTANEVIEALAGTVPWNPRTIRTLLSRLVGKGALGFRQEGRAYLYSPLAEEAACVHAESESFLARVFDGAVEPMLAHFIEGRKLTPGEIAELRRLLDEEEEGA